MTSYRHYDTALPAKGRNRSFFYELEQHSKHQHHCCLNSRAPYDNCNKCSKCSTCCKCSAPTKEHSKEPSFDYFQSNHDETVLQDGDQVSTLDQESTELIWVKESCNIEVNSTDTQVAASLQAGLELAIALVINITIGSSEEADGVSQELLQHVSTKQKNKQKIFIYNTKDANVTTTDTDVAINIQALLQVLVALVVMIDIL
ncbi:spore coat protein [Virgibacillus oceani]